MAFPTNALIHQWYRLAYEGQEYQWHSWWHVEFGTAGFTVEDSLNILNDHFAAMTVDGTIGKEVKDTVPQNVNIVDTNCQMVFPTRSVYVRKPIATAGGWAENANTGNLSAAITLYTMKGGRDQISVRHVGPVPDDALVSGELSAGFLVQLTALAAAMLEPINLEAGGLVVEATIVHPDGTWDELIGSRLSTRAGTMRRRTLRVGI